MAKILVVDDEEHVRDVVRQMLEQAGHEVREAADGVEALDQVGAWQPDLVLTDILMPNKGGLVLIKELRERDPRLPIVATSGGGRTGKLNFLSTARTFKGVVTLKKPFSRRELLAAVGEALGAAPSA
ncbi:MAG: response regulator [Candidatus Dadabacteria bacterium]|nr:MAG: response regulator [Candidatus Dadabacteria bacterium]